MQKPTLELKEIIWEVTGACKNHCSYCGSKTVWDEQVDESKILDILEEILKYPPKEIDISGGDPLLVSYDTHAGITSSLKMKGVKCKIIVNPKSLVNPKLTSLGQVDELALKLETLNLYDVVGISVNDKEDLKVFPTNLKKPVAVITNFNLTNIFTYDHIEALVKKNNYTWIIQFTMTDDNTALYLEANEDAKHYLEKKVLSSMREHVKVLLSDNLTDSPCSAGTNSLGILSNGDVVGCLSMRSWRELNDGDHIEGNLLRDSLEKIWMESFQAYRFQEFECCKDACENCVLIDPTKLEIEEKLKDWKPMNPLYPQVSPSWPNTKQWPRGPKKETVYVYGVDLISPWS
jgi:MoaA/NifB/PqqE/SkfB family radical SAM enzyme